ncbi:uncharacterized protein [Prorops nasuta]|uniref:uncharacterized protein n=1 Tax=Prorops nasuta TaxID=863751 RepID=UPI0034D004C6
MVPNSPTNTCENLLTGTGKTIVSGILTHLAEYRFAINSSFHASAGVTPAFLNFGREIECVRDPQARETNPGDIQLTETTAWAERLQRMQHLHDIVKRQMEKASVRQANYYNKGRRDLTFKSGDLVWKRNHTLSSAAKLAPRFSGPYTIARVISPVIYELIDPDSRRSPQVHISDLKPFVAVYPEIQDDLNELHTEAPIINTSTREHPERKATNPSEEVASPTQPSSSPTLPRKSDDLRKTWSGRLRARS